MTTTNRPRLRRDYSLTMRRVVWFCRGSGVLGYADSPRNAYRDWVGRMHLHGLMPYPSPEKK